MFVMINVHLLIACFCVLISLCNDFYWQSDLQLQPTISMPWRTCTHTLSLSLLIWKCVFRGIGSRWCVVLVSLLHLFYTDLIAIYPPIKLQNKQISGLRVSFNLIRCQCVRNTKLLFSLITFPFFTLENLRPPLVRFHSISSHRFFSPHIHCFIHLPFFARFVCARHNMCIDKWL